MWKLELISFANHLKSTLVAQATFMELNIKGMLQEVKWQSNYQEKLCDSQNFYFQRFKRENVPSLVRPNFN